MNIGDPDGLACLTIHILEELGIAYMVTGSVASFLYGEPRATNDLDIVIAPTDETLISLVQALEPSAYVSREAAREAYRRNDMFNAIGFETAEKIDFIMLKHRPYDEVAFERRRRESLEQLQFDVSTAEDSILSKLCWARRGRSESQLRDVYGILRISAETLDRKYLGQWGAELGVLPTLEALQKEIADDSEQR